jgi:phospholipase C
MKRRDALKTLGALAGAGAASRLLPGCGDDGGGGGPDAAPPGSITHVVMLMMENRTYDHLLGARSMLEGKPGDGITAGMAFRDSGGLSVPIWPATNDSICVLDPPHGWDSSHRQFNGGANDSFLIEHQADHAGDIAAVQYLTREHVPVTWALADEYMSCDRWFASLMGPTIPNRMYWHSGQSNGIKVNDVTAGGFLWDTLYDRLNTKGVEWAYYFGDVPMLAVVDRLVEGGRMRDFVRFLDDAKFGRLPPVTVIDPAYTANDDHPPHHPIFGQQLIATIYTALANSPHWNNCLFVITYDEHGGFFDHVAPPKAEDDRAADGFDQLGFRVPTVIAGPYVKTGVSSTVYDHTSVLKHLEKMFDLAPLTRRSAAANDLSDVIDQERLAAGNPRAPATIPAVEIDQSMIGAACYGGTGKLHHDILEWFDSTGSRYAHLDRRTQVADYLHTMGDFLDQHNAGRVRR